MLGQVVIEGILNDCENSELLFSVCDKLGNENMRWALLTFCVTLFLSGLPCVRAMFLGSVY